MNYADSEKIHMILLWAWSKKVLDPVKADVIVLNTCSVRQKWEDRVFGFIHEVQQFHKKNATGKTPLFWITGCMVRKTGVARRYIDLENYERNQALKISLLNSEELLANYDDNLFLRSNDIDFTFRIEEVAFLTKILSFILGKDIWNDAKFNEYLAVKQLQENPASANIIIQTGCDNYCTYCIVPYTRGRELSRPAEDIVNEIWEVVQTGTKEVTLLWQNVNSYGKETKKKLWDMNELTWINKEVTTPFRELLNDINQIKELDRIRFTSSNPHDMTKDILDAHFELDKMCPYLHFALQSGSNSMLKRMNRKHTYEDFKAQVEYLRSKNPLFSISTDIIVWFPNETEEEFQETVRAMKECEFDFAYIARYSPRSGTFAHDKYEDDISPQEKARRWNILNDLLEESVLKRSQMMIGREEEVLISWKGRNDGWVGRTRNFKEVFLPSASDVKIGQIVLVKIQSLEG